MPFKPGPDPNRNLNGRPPTGEAYADLARQFLGEEIRTLPSGEKITRRKALLLKLYQIAMKDDGNYHAALGLLERADGRPVQPINAGDNSLRIIIDPRDIPNGGSGPSPISEPQRESQGTA